MAIAVNMAQPVAPDFHSCGDKQKKANIEKRAYLRNKQRFNTISIRCDKWISVAIYRTSLKNVLCIWTEPFRLKPRHIRYASGAVISRIFSRFRAGMTRFEKQNKRSWSIFLARFSVGIGHSELVKDACFHKAAHWINMLPERIIENLIERDGKVVCVFSY